MSDKPQPSAPNAAQRRTISLSTLKKLYFRRIERLLKEGHSLDEAKRQSAIFLDMMYRQPKARP